MKATCSVEDCDKVAISRGWCFMHYQRWRRHGDVSQTNRRVRKAATPKPRTTYPRPGSECSVDGCGKTVEKRGWCSMHLSRWKRHGTTDAPPRKLVDPSDHVDRRDDGCWLWTGRRDRDGYGRFVLNGKPTFAHRWAYAEANGPIPDGMDVDHLCFVRLCVNPAHLEAVSRSENSKRMWAAGRGKGGRALGAGRGLSVGATDRTRAPTPDRTIHREAVLKEWHV